MVQDSLLNPYGSADSALCGFGLVWFVRLAVGRWHSVRVEVVLVAPKVTECGSHLLRGESLSFSFPHTVLAAVYGCCLTVTALLASPVDCFTF